MSADTSTMVATGRISPNTSACTAPTSRHSEMSVTYMRVRTTSESDAAGLLKRNLDAAQGLPGLGGDVVAGAGGARHHDVWAGAHGARITDRGLVLRAGRHVAALRHQYKLAGSSPVQAVYSSGVD